MELGDTPSNILLTGFTVLPVLIACWWIWISGRAYSVDHVNNSLSSVTNYSPAAPFNYKAAALTAVVLVLWLIAAAYVGHQDWAHTFDSFPPPGVRVFLAFIVTTIIVALTKAGRVLAINTPLWLLIGFQVFRIPVELLIHQAYLENITIVEMTYFGRNFDIITGILALAIAIYAFKKEISNTIILMWNILGLAFLINVVAIGVFSMPHNIQLIETDIANIWVTFFPFIWLPFVLVCSALFGHLLVFRYLFAQRVKQGVLTTQYENNGQ